MRDLVFGLKNLVDEEKARQAGLRQQGIAVKGSSESSCANRKAILKQCGKELYAAGYRHLKSPGDIKGRHINALLMRWKAQGLSVGTLKNRMAALRWLADKIGKRGLIPNDNMVLGIPHRCYVTNQSKAVKLTQEVLNKIPNEYVRFSLELQAAFGLRREEAIKFQVSYADQGNHLRLKSSWTKGGKERLIPIQDESQRELLNRVHQFAGSGSLIPRVKLYVQQMRVFEKQTSMAGLSRTHGLRHCYAQTRYIELTGRPAPAVGGATSKDLTKAEKEQDYKTRLLISKELGHERESITAQYLGR